MEEGTGRMGGKEEAEREGWKGHEGGERRVSMVIIPSPSSAFLHACEDPQNQHQQQQCNHELPRTLSVTVRRDEYFLDRIAEVLVTSWSAGESSSGREEKDGSSGGSGSREGEWRETSRDKEQVVAGGADAGSLVISKLLYKHHPHMRLFSLLPASVSLPHNIAPPPTQPLESAASGEEASAKEASAREASALAPNATTTADCQLVVNSMASWLAGCEVRGPAVVAVVEASWSDSRRGEMEEEGVVAWDVYRRLLARQPRGMYQLSLEAPVLASLPLSFSSKSLWRGKHPKPMLLDLCTMQRAIDSSPMCMGMCGFKTEHQQQQEQEQQQGKDGRQDQEQKDEDREKAHEEQEGQLGQCCCEHKSMQLAVGDPVFEFLSPSGSVIPTTTATTTGTGIGTGQGSGGASGGTSGSNTTNGNSTAVNIGGFKCRVTINRGPSSPPLVALSPRCYAARMDAVHAACLEALRAIQREYEEGWGRVVDPWGAWRGEREGEQGEKGEVGERMEICTGDGNGADGEEREEKEREEESREEEEEGDGTMARKRLKEVDDSSTTRPATSAAAAVLGSSSPGPSSPSPTPAALGCLVSIAYTVSLQKDERQRVETQQEGGKLTRDPSEEVCLESRERFEFEFGRGCVDERIETVIGRLLPGQTADVSVPIRGHLPPFPALEKIRPAAGRLVLHWRVTLLSVAAAEEEDPIDAAIFFPSLSNQRLAFAAALISKHAPAFLLDVGCGSASLFDYLLSASAATSKGGSKGGTAGCDNGSGSNVDSLCLPASMVGFDISQKELERAGRSLTRTITSLQAATQPPAEATGSSTPQAQVQPSPETTCTAAEGAALARLGLYAGSLADVDDRMKCADVATCLEVVEHLDEEPLAAFGAVVLGALRPRVLLVSTPNIEYNPAIRAATAAAVDSPAADATATVADAPAAVADAPSAAAASVTDAAVAATVGAPATSAAVAAAAAAVASAAAAVAGAAAASDAVTALANGDKQQEPPPQQPQEAAGQVGGGKKRRKKKKGQQAGQQAGQTGQQPQEQQQQQQQELRNSDHRFEWTRKEFESWANALAQEYGYHVTFGGVGVLPEAEHLGFATQTAVFERAACDVKDLGLDEVERMEIDSAKLIEDSEGEKMYELVWDHQVAF
ncbi:unnamed protein product [Closterium sp. NIES-54]